MYPLVSENGGTSVTRSPITTNRALIKLHDVSNYVIILRADILHWITITVAVVLLIKGVAAPSETFKSAKEVVTMISIDTVIALIMLAITAASFILQLASFINTKNDRLSSKH